MGPVMKRFVLFFACCLGLLAATWHPAEALDSELGIGSEAPALDVEHWIQDGNGFFKPVREFESGKVYVVEFWATWCGPCVASMPHLAQMQQEYRGQGVQVISISDEALEEVEAFLERPHPELDKTFREVTSAYSLTTDPDGSSHEAFMAASGQTGIPAAFLVGKTGQIEWIGHPTELDEPLEAVVNDSWDREAYQRELELRQEMERLQQETMQEVSALIEQEKVDSAITLIESRISSAQNEEIATVFRDLLHQVKFGTGRHDAETLAYYRKRLSDAKGNALAVGQFAFMVHGAMQQGVDPGPLAAESIEALQAEVSGADDQVKPMLYVVLAQLHVGTDDLPAAIAAMQEGVDASQGRQQERLEGMLEELRERASNE